MNSAYYIFLVLLVLWLLHTQRRNLWLLRRIKSRKPEERIKMKAFAERFIEKEVILYTFNGNQITGIIREVTDSALLLACGDTLEAVNLDFIVRIREYPRRKNGKKKSVVLD